MVEDTLPVAGEHLRLVHACCRRYRDKGIEYDDLFQAGCMGLIKATQGFDESLGYQFSTYAVPLILGEIKRLFRTGGGVKMSRSLKERSLLVARAREELAVSLSREPSLSEVAAAAGLSPEEAAEALDAGRPVLSLSDSGEDGEGGQNDLPVPSGEEELLEQMTLRQSLDALTGRDRSLIFLRYFGSKTQSEVASLLGMTQVQVSRRERKILLSLRERLT